MIHKLTRGLSVWVRRKRVVGVAAWCRPFGPGSRHAERLTYRDEGRGRHGERRRRLWMCFSWLRPGG
jgi:hypothetical protein